MARAKAGSGTDQHARRFGSAEPTLILDVLEVLPRPVRCVAPWSFPLGVPERSELAGADFPRDVITPPPPAIGTAPPMLSNDEIVGHQDLGRI